MSAKKGATVEELLDALKSLLDTYRFMPVCLSIPPHLEELTSVELRSDVTGTIDLYSCTPESALSVGGFARRLNTFAMRGAANFEVSIFVPGAGALPLTDISSDGDSLILAAEL